MQRPFQTANRWISEREYSVIAWEHKYVRGGRPLTLQDRYEGEAARVFHSVAAFLGLLTGTAALICEGAAFAGVVLSGGIATGPMLAISGLGGVLGVTTLALAGLSFTSQARYSHYQTLKSIAGETDRADALEELDDANAEAFWLAISGLSEVIDQGKAADAAARGISERRQLQAQVRQLTSAKNILKSLRKWLRLLRKPSGVGPFVSTGLRTLIVATDRLSGICDAVTGIKRLLSRRPQPKKVPAKWSARRVAQSRRFRVSLAKRGSSRIWAGVGKAIQLGARLGARSVGLGQSARLAASILVRGRGLLNSAQALRSFFFHHATKDGDFTGPFPGPGTAPIPDHILNKGLAPEYALGRGAALFVNGIMTSLSGHEGYARELATRRKTTFVGIYNASGGFVPDLVQSAGDKLFDPGRIAGKSNPAIARLRSTLRLYPRVREIWAHSQGAIIVSEALRQEKASGVDIRDYKVTTLGGAAWTYPTGPRYSHWTYVNDPIPGNLGKTRQGLNEGGTGSTIVRGYLPKGWSILNPMAAHGFGSYMEQYDAFSAEQQRREEGVLRRGSPPAWQCLRGLSRLGKGALGPMVPNLVAGGLIRGAASRTLRRAILQRSGHGEYAHADPGALLQSLTSRSAGSAPDHAVRSRLSRHLGFDPKIARLHTSPAAADAARDLSADAFTIGRDVFFGAGRYDPASNKGLGLIAHELTHVGQQTNTGDKARFFSRQGGDAMEQEAQRTAERVFSDRGRMGGLFIEEYRCTYESSDGSSLSRSDQDRLDRISVAAIEAAERILLLHGIGSATVESASLHVELDLSEMTDSQAVREWANAIVTASEEFATPDAPLELSPAIQRQLSQPSFQFPSTKAYGEAARPDADSDLTADDTPGTVQRAKRHGESRARPSSVKPPGQKAGSGSPGSGRTPEIDRLRKAIDATLKSAQAYQEENARIEGDRNLAMRFVRWRSGRCPAPSMWNAPMALLKSAKKACDSGDPVRAQNLLARGRAGSLQCEVIWKAYLRQFDDKAGQAIGVAESVRDTDLALGAATIVAMTGGAGAAAASAFTGTGFSLSVQGAVAGIGGSALFSGGIRGIGSSIGQALGGKVNWRTAGAEAARGAWQGTTDAVSSLLSFGTSKFLKTRNIINAKAPRYAVNAARGLVGDAAGSAGKHSMKVMARQESPIEAFSGFASDVSGSAMGQAVRIKGLNLLDARYNRNKLMAGLAKRVTAKAGGDAVRRIARDYRLPKWISRSALPGTPRDAGEGEEAAKRVADRAADRAAGTDHLSEVISLDPQRDYHAFLARSERIQRFYRQRNPGKYASQRRLYGHAAASSLTQPVVVDEMSPGTMLVQYQFPGDPMGEYFALPTADPMRLGIQMERISPSTLEVVRRERREYQVVGPVPFLQTTAVELPINDETGIGGKGGEAQFVIGARDHGRLKRIR